METNRNEKKRNDGIFYSVFCIHIHYRTGCWLLSDDLNATLIFKSNAYSWDLRLEMLYQSSILLWWCFSLVSDIARLVFLKCIQRQQTTTCLFILARALHKNLLVLFINYSTRWVSRHWNWHIRNHLGRLEWEKNFDGVKCEKNTARSERKRNTVDDANIKIKQNRKTKSKSKWKWKRKSQRKRTNIGINEWIGKKWRGMQNEHSGRGRGRRRRLSWKLKYHRRIETKSSSWAGCKLALRTFEISIVDLWNFKSNRTTTKQQ